MLSRFTKKIAFKYQWLGFILLYSNHLSALEKEKVVTPTESLLPMLGGLLAILAMIFLLAFVFKRFSNFGLSSKSIKVVESQVIGNKEKLMIIQVYQQQFLIGVTGHSISQLGELNQPLAKAESSFDKEKNSDNIRPNEFDINTLPFGKIISQLIKSPVENSSKKILSRPSPAKPRATVK